MKAMQSPMRLTAAWLSLMSLSLAFCLLCTPVYAQTEPETDGAPSSNDAAADDAAADDAAADDAAADDAAADDAAADDDNDASWTDEDEAWAEGDESSPTSTEDEDNTSLDDAQEDDSADAASGDESTEEDGTTGEATESEDAEPEVEGQADALVTASTPIPYRPAVRPNSPDDFQLLFPPFLYERRSDRETIATFPLFYWQASDDTQELVVPPYYYQRGENNWDVLFPMFWWYRGEDHHTWIVPPVWSHSAPDGFDFGIGPLVMAGRHDASHYTILPPLLSFDWGIDDVERYTFSLLFWRAWEPDEEHWGLFPFLWVENTDRTSYVVQPPFFFRFVDEDEGTALTVVPPFYHRDEPNGSYWGIPPLFHHSSGDDHTSTTLFPLLSHYSEEPDAFRLTIAGVFWYWQDHDDETLVTPLYQRFRGATEMDAVAPFFFSIRDPRDGSSSLLIPPFFFNFENPGSQQTVLFPFFANFVERGRNSTWFTPLFGQHIDHELEDTTTWALNLQVSQWHDGDSINLHPLFYFESVPSHRHIVVSPLYWDFENFEGEGSRYTVAFPFFWRFQEGRTTSTLVMNVYHRERIREDGSDWEFHIFPFFSYGESSRGDHWWKIFFGLAGYERRGPYGVTTLCYVPFQTDGPPLPTDSGTSTPRTEPRQSAPPPSSPMGPMY